MSDPLLLQEGFNTAQLKIIAVVCMTIDHIGYYLSGLLPIPFWFGIIGRIAAPLFFFCTAKGLHYTHDRVAYCRRLYLAAVLMAFGNVLINHWVRHPLGLRVDNAIFSTLFYVAFFVTSLDSLKDAGSKDELRRIFLSAGLLLLPFAIGFLEGALPRGLLRQILQIVLPSPFTVEGGVLWILFGIGLYYCMGSRRRLAAYYLLICLFFFLVEGSMGFNVRNLIVENHQWLMLLALPLILRYNEQKGKSSKWFFYIYYPAHIYLLFLAASMLR